MPLKAKIKLLVALAACLVSLARAQTDAWLEVRTPHFLIVSNASEKEARRAARQFEGMRSVFQRVFPQADLDTAAPMLVMAVRDKSSFQALEPADYLGEDKITLMGLFTYSPDKNDVLILLDAPGSHPYAPIYHEYAHFVFSRLQQWMPLWLGEGLAEFYQNTEILDDRIRLGKADPAFQQVLDRTPLLPLSTLFAVDAHSPYYHENNKGSIFYIESWALTHYLKDQDDQNNTHHLDDFLALLQKNVDPISAAAQAFGDLSDLELKLRRYTVTGHYGVTEIAGSAAVDDSSFTARALSSSETDLFRADMLHHAGRDQEAQNLSQRVLQNDANSAKALELLGSIAYHQHHFDEARKWCEQAIQLDPNNFNAHYLLAASMIQHGVPDAASQDLAEQNLRAAAKINPSFAPAYDSLAILYTLHRSKLPEAYELIQKAVLLVPGSPELRVDEAQVLAQMDKNQEAETILQLALRLSHTPEQVALVENMRQSIRQYTAERTQLHAQNAASTPTYSSPEAARAMKKAGIEQTPPHPIYSPDVEYTPAALAARFEGSCVVSMSVGVDGKATNITLDKKLGLGMDEQILATVSKWKFEPERRNGKAFASRLQLTLNFHLFGQNSSRFAELSAKAQEGNADAEFQLAQDFFLGGDIPKDEKQGMALLERAARSGHPEAMFQMGERLYGDGKNPDSYVSAYVWYVRAQRAGSTHAPPRITDLESRMTPDQLSDAHKQLSPTASRPE